MDWVAELNRLWRPQGRRVVTMTDEWKLARRGRLTASSRARSIAGPRAVGNFPKLKEKILAELRPDYQWVEQQFAATEWGNDYEYEALLRLRTALGMEPDQFWEPGFVLHPDRVYAGGTPDAMFCTDRLTCVQVKCPHDQAIHKKTRQTRKLSNDTYGYQIQWEGWISGADALMFASYDPRAKREEHQLAYFDVPVDYDLRRIFEERCDQFLDFMEGRVATSRAADIESLAASF
jgi:hypothetical protein